MYFVSTWSVQKHSLQSSSEEPHTKQAVGRCTLRKSQSSVLFQVTKDQITQVAEASAFFAYSEGVIGPFWSLST